VIQSARPVSEHVASFVASVGPRVDSAASLFFLSFFDVQLTSISG
jgi:hypothetical protein